MTPTQERDAALIALGKSLVEQITALNRTIAQGNAVGLQFNLYLTGTNLTPEIQSIYHFKGNKIRNIYADVMQHD